MRKPCVIRFMMITALFIDDCDAAGFRVGTVNYSLDKNKKINRIHHQTKPRNIVVFSVRQSRVAINIH